MGNLVTQSTALLPMDDIAEELKVKYNFSSATDAAKDTEKVSGTASNLIAVAATTPEGTLVKDRETVKNTLQLGGVDASKYMTKEDGSKVETFGSQVSKIYADEIAALRDELYQLRGELTRQGIVTEYGPYAGFQDYFRAGDKKYVFQSFGGITQNSTATVTTNKIYPEQWDTFKVGECFVIHKNAQNLDYVVVTTAVETGAVTFSTVDGAGIPSTGLETGNVELFKSLGSYNKGGYSFSKISANALTGKEQYVMLNDDSKTTMAPIQNAKYGYAAAFSIPSMIVDSSSNACALKSYSVVAKSYNSPGALSCYVMKDTDDNRLALKNLENELIGPSEKVIAKSNTIASNAQTLSLPTKIDFNFQNPVDGSYPILQGKARYIFIIVAEQANNGGDMWEIQFTDSLYSSTNPDVQTNNKAYTYVPDIGLKESTVLGDMIFIMAAIEVQSNSESPYAEGLYTSEPISIKNNDEISRARLTMRVAREGFFVAEDSGLCGDGGTFSIKNDGTNGDLPTDLGMRAGDTIAVGTEIRKLATDVKSMQLTVEKGLYIEPEASIYKVGYKAYIRAYKKVWDATKTDFTITNEQFIAMLYLA
jgi:hypothetical protein